MHHPDESLLEYIGAMQELHILVDLPASSQERVDRVIRQYHPTFAIYLRGAPFRTLSELAIEAKYVQGDILAACYYRPPPPASPVMHGTVRSSS